MSRDPFLPARLSAAVIEIDVVLDTIVRLVGTVIPDDAPLMSAGLDSIAATELVSTLGQNLSTEIEPTALFDHPTIGSLGKYFAVQLRPAVAPTDPGIGTLTVFHDREPSCEPRSGNVLVVADAFHLPTAERSLTEGDLGGMSRARYDTCGNVPLARWDMESVDSRRFNAAAR